MHMNDRIDRTVGTARLRGLLALALCLCMALSLLPAPAQAAETPTDTWLDNAEYYDTSWYGDGSAKEYSISTAEQLAGLASLASRNNQFTGKTIRLTADIDLSAHLWKPISYFAGTFDGRKHTIRGLTITRASTVSTGGFFHSLSGKAYRLDIEDASVSSGGYGSSVGILAGYNEPGAEIYDCSVSGRVSVQGVSGGTSYVGGLVGRNSGSVKNCRAQLSTIKGNAANGINIGGIAGLGAVENCYASADSVEMSGTSQASYRLAPAALYSYWNVDTALDDVVGTSGIAPVYTQCSSVTADQIAGTGGPIIADGTYAQTGSLTEALNNWVEKANAGGKTYNTWTLGSSGSPTMLEPRYIGINGPLQEHTPQSAAGNLKTGMNLRGQVAENVTLLTVTLPASIPFVLDVDGTGKLRRLLSATGTLSSSSECGVNISLASVSDKDGLLGKADLFLLPDPAPGAGVTQIPLAEGSGKTYLLASLAAPGSGGATTATLKLGGGAKAGGSQVGRDGDEYLVGLTLKVSKQ